MGPINRQILREKNLSDRSLRTNYHSLQQGCSVYQCHYLIDIMDDDNFVTALEDQIKISVALIWMVRKQSIKPMQKAQKTIQVTTQTGVMTIFHPLLSR